MEQDHVPSPRYSKEYQKMAVTDERPLYTLDICYPKGVKPKTGIRRMTSTGVLSVKEIDSLIARLNENRPEPEEPK